MRYRKLDDQGDYTIGQGKNNFFQDEPMVVGQAIHTKLGLLEGEWFLDTTLGVPYSKKLLGKSKLDSHYLSVQETILRTKGVIDIDHFYSTVLVDSSQAMVFCSVNTRYGKYTLQKVL